jgi:hypothetical protein
MSTIPGSSSSTQMVMASSELPRTMWTSFGTSFGGAVKVFMPIDWHGQCQNQIANRLARPSITLAWSLRRVSGNPTASNQLRRRKGENNLAEAENLLAGIPGW